MPTRSYGDQCKNAPASTTMCTSTSKMACSVSPNSSIPRLPFALSDISSFVNPETSTTSATPGMRSPSNGGARLRSPASCFRTTRERNGRSAVACFGVR
eukprot:817-Pelagococcus_subviridis.AAC.3